MAAITCDGQIVKIDGLVVEDPGLAELLRAQPEDRWEEIVERALVVGVRGLLTMGLGIDLGEVDARVRRTVEEVTSEASRQVEAVLRTAERAFTEQFDPRQRSSVVGQALEEFGAWRDRFLQGFDPDYADSHTARFLDQLTELLGPQGLLETRIRAALDPDADGSALGRLSRTIDGRFTELRDLLVGEEKRAQEARRGTAKGFVFEDVVEEHLRSLARAVGGCVVERTGHLPGELGSEATVGDFVFVLPTGQRLVVEAKNAARIDLTGEEGILAELDRAKANRRASVAVCVSAGDAFPKEVGSFGVYGDRVLVVDDGEGTMLSVAIRTAELLAGAAGPGPAASLDPQMVLDRLEGVRGLAQLFSSNHRRLTEIGASVKKVQDSLASMRIQLLEQLDDLVLEIQRACREGEEGS